MKSKLKVIHSKEECNPNVSTTQQRSMESRMKYYMG